VYFRWLFDNGVFPSCLIFSSSFNEVESSLFRGAGQAVVVVFLIGVRRYPSPSLFGSVSLFFRQSLLFEHNKNRKKRILLLLSALTLENPILKNKTKQKKVDSWRMKGSPSPSSPKKERRDFSAGPSDEEVNTQNYIYILDVQSDMHGSLLDRLYSYTCISLLSLSLLLFLPFFSSYTYTPKSIAYTRP
jgi:hypothetical protein